MFTTTTTQGHTTHAKSNRCVCFFICLAERQDEQHEQYSSLDLPLPSFDPLLDLCCSIQLFNDLSHSGIKSSTHCHHGSMTASAARWDMIAERITVMAKAALADQGFLNLGCTHRIETAIVMTGTMIQNLAVAKY